MFGSLGLPELLIILLIVIIIFGANKLPQLGKGLGQGLANFKDRSRATSPARRQTRSRQPGLLASARSRATLAGIRRDTRESRHPEERSARDPGLDERGLAALGMIRARQRATSLLLRDVRGDAELFAGSRMLRIPTLLRSVLRWMPREVAARPRFPERSLHRADDVLLLEFFLGELERDAVGQKLVDDFLELPVQIHDALPEIPIRMRNGRGAHLSKRKIERKRIAQATRPIDGRAAAEAFFVPARSAKKKKRRRRASPDFFGRSEVEPTSARPGRRSRSAGSSR